MSSPMPISKLNSYYSSADLLIDPPARRSRSQEIKSLTDRGTDEMFGQQFTSHISSTGGFDSDDDLFAIDEPVQDENYFYIPRSHETLDLQELCKEKKETLEKNIRRQLDEQEVRINEAANKLNAEFQEHRLKGLHRSERISEEALCEAIKLMKMEQEQSNQKEEGQ